MKTDNKFPIMKILFVLWCIVFFNMSDSIVVHATNWKWFYSDDYYSEYINLNSLNVIKNSDGSIDHIEVWTKTTYDDAGRNGVIKDYDLQNVPYIEQLTNSMGLLYIKPNERQYFLKQEIFYNDNGSSLWSNDKNTIQWQEICPNDYMERYLTYITDYVFHDGKSIDFAMWQNNNRWVLIDDSSTLDGKKQKFFIDKLSMRKHNEEISYWTLMQIYNENGVVDRFYVKTIFDKSAKVKKDIMVNYKVDNLWKLKHITDSSWKPAIPDTVGAFVMQNLIDYTNKVTVEFTDVTI